MHSCRRILAVGLTACGGLPEPSPLTGGPPVGFDLHVSDPIVDGGVVQFQVRNAPPGATVRIVRSDGDAGAGGCPALLQGSCFGITQGTSGYRAVLTLTADASGTARRALSVQGVPLGQSAFQAVVLRPAGAVLSNPVVRAVVDNAPPVVDRVVISPRAPRTSDVVQCQVSATDPDGPDPGVTVLWDVDGIVVGVGATLTLSPARVQPGDALVCRAVAVDEDGSSAVGADAVVVANTPPVFSHVSVFALPGVPGLSGVQCAGVAIDADGGSPVVSYRWDTGPGTPELGTSDVLDTAGAGLGVGDTVRCVATAVDAFGGQAVGSATQTLVDPTVIVPLYDAGTPLDPPVREDVGSALVTRLGDRGRDRHAREDVFAAYDHYLSHYWEHRTVAIEIVDTVGRVPGGDITFHVTTQFPLQVNQAELRFFYRGLNTVAEYHDNGVMSVVGPLQYTRSVAFHGATGQPLRIGDLMEFELSQFLDGSVQALGGRANYYGTTFLYVVGEGIVPWQADTELGTDVCPCDDEFSYPVPAAGLLGGLTTLHSATSGEPRDHFMQMATNLAGDHAQPFVLGRRLAHTEFGGGTHTENGYEGGVFIDNPPFIEQIGKLGPRYVNDSCDACHVQNTRALPPAVGEPLDQHVVRVGDVEGRALPGLGAVFQGGDDLGVSEGTVWISGWTEAGGLRTPVYGFSGDVPEAYSARIAPQLVGMGLIEAIAETDVLALADPADLDGDGISGRPRTVVDLVTGDVRLGRFGYKAGVATLAQQVASALNTDMGVMTSVAPAPDCGAAQGTCGPSGAELDDADLADLTAYVALLGIRPRRDLDDPSVQAGESLFSALGCASCHVPTLRTSPYAPHAELRDQLIHPYTDLLLHDMGPGLADTLPEGDATGSEWRTAPLWSVGLTIEVNQGEAYLHDGRARTLDEAIRWHGGEGQASKEAYEALAPADRDAVVTFLRSL